MGSHARDLQGLKTWEPEFCDAIGENRAVQVQPTYWNTGNKLVAGLSRLIPMPAANPQTTSSLAEAVTGPSSRQLFFVVSVS